MRHFAESIIALAPIAHRKSRNRFLRDVDRWTDRLYRLDLINIHQRQRLRANIADACASMLT